MVDNETKEKIRLLRAKGLTPSAIAGALDVDLSTVQQFLSENPPRVEPSRVLSETLESLDMLVGEVTAELMDKGLDKKTKIELMRMKADLLQRKTELAEKLSIMGDAGSIQMSEEIRKRLKGIKDEHERVRAAFELMNITEEQILHLKATQRKQIARVCEVPITVVNYIVHRIKYHGLKPMRTSTLAQIESFTSPNEPPKEEPERPSETPKTPKKPRKRRRKWSEEE